ncbi:unnamed protein product (mitochondrion) [Plasmodiophora brassicae]|uniref:Uncharacterized protein n=1 Tax=Plasmodiophora brassicae TaxID=37360 RepID=A0A3P3Y476_PLABS|nr:unnamed protein product [Plasmodiophora brassicae]
MLVAVLVGTFLPLSLSVPRDIGEACSTLFDIRDPIRAELHVPLALSLDAFPAALAGAKDVRKRRCLLLTFSRIASRLPDGEFCSHATGMLRMVTTTSDNREVSAMHAACAAFIVYRSHSIPCSGRINARDDPRLRSISLSLNEIRDDPFGERTSPKALLAPVANLFGDAWASSLGVDGFVNRDALRFMHTLLSKIRGKREVEEQHHQLGIAALFAWSMDYGEMIEDNALFLAELAKTFLAVSKKVVVPVGWKTTDSGHAMLMEVTYDDVSNKLAVSIFNAGAGSSDAHAFVKHLDRVNVVPMVKFVKVPSDALLHTLDVLFHLFSMMTGPRTQIPLGSEQYGPDDIYQRILQPLHRYHEGSIREPSTRFQQSGTCTMKSQLAYLHVTLGDHKFRLVKEDLQRAAVDVMTSSLLAHDDNTIGDPHSWLFILRAVARNMARRQMKLSTDAPTHNPGDGGLLFNDDAFRRAYGKVKALAESVPMRFAIQKQPLSNEAINDPEPPFLDNYDYGTGLEPPTSMVAMPSQVSIRSDYSTPSKTVQSLQTLLTLTKKSVMPTGNDALIAQILAIPGHVLHAEHYSTMSSEDAGTLADSINSLVRSLDSMAETEQHWDGALARNKLLIVMWRVTCRLDLFVADRGSIPLLTSFQMSNHMLCRLRHSKYLLSYDRSLMDQLDDMFEALTLHSDSCDPKALPLDFAMRSLTTNPTAFRQWLLHIATRITIQHKLTREAMIEIVPPNVRKEFGDLDTACVVYGLLVLDRLRVALGEPAAPAPNSSISLSQFVLKRLMDLVYLWDGSTASGYSKGHFGVEHCQDPGCPIEVSKLPGEDTPDLTPTGSCMFDDLEAHPYGTAQHDSKTGNRRLLKPRSMVGRLLKWCYSSKFRWPAIHTAIGLARSSSDYQENDFLVNRQAIGHRVTLSTMFRERTRIPSLLFAWQSGHLDVTNYTHQDVIDFALFQGPVNVNGGLQELCLQRSPLIDAVLQEAQTAMRRIAPATGRDQRTILWLYALTFRVRSFRPASDAECRARRDLRRELEDRIDSQSGRDVWASPVIRSLAHAVIIIASAVDDDCRDGRDRDWLKDLVARQARRLDVLRDDDVDSGIAPAYRHIHHQADLFMAQKSGQIVDYLHTLTTSTDLWDVLHGFRERRRGEVAAVGRSDDAERRLAELASSLRWACVNDLQPSCFGSGPQGTCSFDLMSAEVRCQTADGAVLGEFAVRTADMHQHPFLVSRLRIGLDPSITIGKEYDNPPTYSVMPSPSSRAFWTKLVIQMPGDNYRRLRETNPRVVVLHTVDARYVLDWTSLMNAEASDLDKAFVRVVLGDIDVDRAVNAKLLWHQIQPSSPRVVLVTDDLLRPVASCFRALLTFSFTSLSTPVLYEFADSSITTSFHAKHGRAFALVDRTTLTAPDGFTSFDVFESQSGSPRCHRVVFYEHIFAGVPVAFSSCTGSDHDDLVWEADPTFVLAPDQRLQ